MSVLSDRVRPAASEDPVSSGAGSTETASVAVDPAPPPRWRGRLAAALAVVVVASLGALVWLTAGGRAASAGPLDHPEEREAVMSLADQFVKRLGTYGPDLLDGSGRMPDYREQVREVITPAFAADFDKEVATAEQLVAQGGITRSTEVFATAVSSVDDDSARVLVAGAFTDSYRAAAGTETRDRSGDRAGQGSGGGDRIVRQEPLPFRFTVDLVLVEGSWLVDDFTPVSAPAGSGGEAGAPATEGSAP